MQLLLALTEYTSEVKQNMDSMKKAIKTPLILKELLNLFSDKRFSELSAFVMSDKDEGITLRALESIYSQADFLLQLLDTKSKEVASLMMKRDINLTYLSHVQKRSADLCRILSCALKNDGINVWLDDQSCRLDIRGVIEGIFTSTSFTIVMTREYFERQWTVFELLVATIFKKEIVILMETDTRLGGFESMRILFA